MRSRVWFDTVLPAFLELGPTEEDIARAERDAAERAVAEKAMADSSS